MHECHMCHFCTSCFSQPFYTRALSWLRQSIAVSIQRICVSPQTNTPLPPCCCLLVEAEWLTGWSRRGVMWLVEMILHREQIAIQDNNIVVFCFMFCCLFFFCCCCLNMMHCTSIVQTPPPSSRCGRPHPQVGSQGRVEQNEVESLFLSLQWERENETEREHKSIHHGSFHPSLCAQTQAAAMLNGKREERGGVGSTDQGSAAISLCIDQWPGAVSGSSPSSPLHLPWCPPPTHFSPYQSSRTCRQRCPPLALHCQRMMQQRHRRWPPPCTEGGGVTGAK